MPGPEASFFDLDKIYVLIFKCCIRQEDVIIVLLTE